MSTIPERHVRVTGESWDGAILMPDPRCEYCEVQWPCETITEYERANFHQMAFEEADNLLAEERAAVSGTRAHVAEQDAARLAALVERSLLYRHGHLLDPRCHELMPIDGDCTCGLRTYIDEAETALRLHDERVKGGTT